MEKNDSLKEFVGAFAANDCLMNGSFFFSHKNSFSTLVAAEVYLLSRFNYDNLAFQLKDKSNETKVNFM